MTEVLSAKTYRRKRHIEKAVGVLDDVDLDAVVQALEELFRPFLLPDQEMPDWRTLILLGRQFLKAKATGVAGADRSRRTKLRSSQQGNTVTKRRTVLVNRTLWQIAQDVEGCYSRDVQRILGLRGRRPQNPDLALDLAIMVRDRLRSDWFAFPAAPGEDCEPLDKEELASRLDRPIALLADALGRRTTQREGAASALGTKREELTSALREGRAIIQQLRSFFLLIGEDEVARRLSLRVPRSRSEADANTSDDGTATSDGGAATSDGGTGTSDGGTATSDDGGGNA